MSAEAQVHGVPSLASVEPWDRQRARTPDSQTSGGGVHLQVKAFGSPQADPAVSSGSFARRLLGVSGGLSLSRAAGGGGVGGGGGEGTEMADHSDSSSRRRASFAHASAGAGAGEVSESMTAKEASSPVVLSSEDVAEGVGDRLGFQGVYVRMRARVCVCVRAPARGPQHGICVRARSKEVAHSCISAFAVA